MFSDHPTRTTLPASDLGRAKNFYSEKLGFVPSHEAPEGLSYTSGPGSRFTLFPSSGTASGHHTQMAWQVPDVDREVAELKARGVVFEEYDTPSFKTVDSVATTEKVKAAWFRDSEGNLLGIAQYVDENLAWA
jgi:catechol 2,3-dioxygenase-like lactoylglutathione lyase family enzyme